MEEEEKRKNEYGIKKKEVIQDAISQVLIDFDFRKVRRVMEFLDWKWAIPEAENDIEFRIPSEVEIKEMAYKLMKEAVKGKRSISSGGLEVIFNTDDFLDYDSDDDNYHCDIGLKFVIESTY